MENNEKIEQYKLLFKSIENHDLDTVKSLKSFIVDNKIAFQEKAINESIYSKFSPMLQLLIDFGLNPASNSDFPLFLACSEGDLDMVKVLINQECVDPTSVYNRSIYAAYESDYLDIVEFLLENEQVKNKLKTQHFISKEIDNYILSKKIEKF